MSDARSATRVLAGSALAGVSVIAGVVSYLHGLAVTEAVGARPPVAYLIPFLADLVILGASAALIDATRTRARRPWLAMVALAAGIGVTAVMNVAAGWRNGTGGARVAGWPAVAFVLALECLAGMVRRGRGVTAPQGVPAAPGQPEPTTAEALAVLLETGSRRQLAAALRVPKSRVDTWAAGLAERGPELAGVSANGSSPDE